MSRIRNTKAFTLIELIVVVIIIGVLAGIAAVAYNQFVAQANTKANVASVKNIAQAMDAASAQDNKDASTLSMSLTGTVFSVGATAVKVSVPTGTLFTTPTVTVKAGCTASAPVSTSVTSVVDITSC